MIAIVDYGVGNLFSLTSSFCAIGADIEVVSDPEKLSLYDKIVLPGVGAKAAWRMPSSAKQRQASPSLASASACSFFWKKAMNTASTRVLV